MKRERMVSLVAAFIVLGILPAARVEGQQASPSQRSPAAQAARTSVLTGSIMALNLTGPAPSLKVAAADGKIVTFALDPKAVSVKQDGKAIKLEALEVGQSVKVHPTVKGGKQMVEAIEIVPAKPTATPAEPRPRPIAPGAPKADPGAPRE